MSLKPCNLLPALLAFAALCLAAPLRAQTATTAGPMSLSAGASPPVFVPAPRGFTQQLATTAGTTDAVTVPDAKANFPAGSSWTVEGRVTFDGAHRAILFCRGDVNAGTLGSIFLALDSGGNPVVTVVTSSGGHGGNYYQPVPAGSTATLCAVYKAGVGLTAYVNGVAHAFPDTDSWDPGTATGTYIGRGTSGDPSDPFQGTSTAQFDEVAISTVAQYSDSYGPATTRFPATRSGQSALYHLDGDLTDADTNTDFTDAGGGGPTGPVPPLVTASWAASVIPYWNNVYNVLTDPRLPAHLVADGGSGTPTDNQPAYTQDCQWLQGQGGGVLYAPAGQYNFVCTGSSGILLTHDVFCEGDGYDPVAGADRTTFVYNVAGTAGGRGVVVFDARNGCGFYGLCLRYGGPAEGASPQASNVGHNLNTAYNAAGTDHVLFKSVHWQMGAGNTLFLQNAAHVAVEDCRIEDGGNYQPINFLYITDLEIARTACSYKEGRFQTLNCSNLLLDGVSLYRAGGKPVSLASGGTSPSGTVDGGGFDVSYCDGAVARNCSVTTTGPLYRFNNDGECFLTQETPLFFSDAGVASSCAPGVLTDSSKSWALAPWDARMRVLFTSGAALGQSALVTGHNKTQAFFAPVSPAPAPGDSYSLLIPSCKDLIVTGCTFVNNPKPLEIGGGGLGVTIQNNVSINSQGFALYSFNVAGHHEPLWNALVTGNTVANPNGEKYSMAGLFVTNDDPAFRASENSALNVSVYGNALTPHPAALTPTVDPTTDLPVAGDGVYRLAFGAHPQPASVLAAMPGVTNGVGPVPPAAASAGVGLTGAGAGAVAAGTGADGKLVLSQAQRDAIQREALRLTQTNARLDPSDPEGQALLVLLSYAFPALLPAFVSTAPLVTGGH